VSFPVLETQFIEWFVGGLSHSTL